MYTLFLVVSVLLMFCMTFNYKGPIYKKIIAVLCFVVVLLAFESALFVIFPAYNPYGIDMDLDTMFYHLVAGILYIAVGYIPGRLKNLRKSKVKSPIIWIISLALPVISIILWIWFTTYLPRTLVPVAVLFVFVFNALTFFMHNTLAASYEEKLKTADKMAERMQTMLDSSPLACVVIDEDFNILETNQRTLELLGISSPDEFISDHLKFSPERQSDGKLSKEKFEEVVNKAFEEGLATCDWVHIDVDGAIIPCELTLKRVVLSEKNMVMRYIHDLREIHALEAAKEQMEKLAFSDWLTDLYNRRYFMDASEKILQHCKDNNLDFSIILMDVDSFKKVNDVYGHGIGDDVLKIFAKRIKQVLRDDEIAARYGGEEFIIALPNTNKENALNVAQRIHENIRKSPFAMENLSIPITASIGVATKQENIDTLHAIIDAADVATYKAKTDGRDRIVFG